MPDSQQQPPTAPPGPHPGPPPELVLAQMHAELEALVNSNKQRLQALAMRGIQMEPAQVLNLRIDCVIQSIAEAMGPKGEAFSVFANLKFEQVMAQNIEHGETEGTKSQLAQGAHMSPAMIREMAKATGTFGGL